MVLVSYSGREINAKIVYYGPGLCGKTTNLESIFGSIPEQHKGRMVSVKTKTERTLFFDFLPVNLGELSGFKTRFLLYTVPGQVYYNATRKLVLKGVDAVVFVADSQKGKTKENVESLQNLRDNLKEQGVSLDDIPLVLQYNKRDLPNVMPVAEMEASLNPRKKVPSFTAVATTGEGVLETFKGISRLLLKHLSKEIGVKIVAPQAGPMASMDEPAAEETPVAAAAVESDAPASVAAPPAAPAAPPSPPPSREAVKEPASPKPSITHHHLGHVGTRDLPREKSPSATPAEPRAVAARPDAGARPAKGPDKAPPAETRDKPAPSRTRPEPVSADATESAESENLEAQSRTTFASRLKNLFSRDSKEPVVEDSPSEDTAPLPPLEPLEKLEPLEPVGKAGAKAAGGAAGDVPKATVRTTTIYPENIEAVREDDTPPAKEQGRAPEAPASGRKDSGAGHGPAGSGLPKVVPLAPAASIGRTDTAEGEADELTIPVVLPRRNTNRPLVLKLQIRFADDMASPGPGQARVDGERRRAVSSD